MANKVTFDLKKLRAKQEVIDKKPDLNFELSRIAAEDLNKVIPKLKEAVETLNSSVLFSGLLQGTSKDLFKIQKIYVPLLKNKSPYGGNVIPDELKDVQVKLKQTLIKEYKKRNNIFV